MTPNTNAEEDEEYYDYVDPILFEDGTFKDMDDYRAFMENILDCLRNGNYEWVEPVEAPAPPTK